MLMKDIILFLLEEKKWSRLTRAYEDKDGNGTFFTFFLGNWKHEGGYANDMYEKMQKLKGLLKTQCTVEEIDNLTSIGGQINVRKELFEEFLAELEQLQNSGGQSQ
jgi:hypothetical protein